MRFILLIFTFYGLLFGFAQTANNSKSFNGNVTEHIINDYMKSNGARMINAQVGSNGIDGLFYKKVNGKMKVFVVESKYNTSNLGHTKTYGKQMSKEWKIGKIDEKINQLNKMLNQETLYKSEINKMKKEISLLQEAKKLVILEEDSSLLFNIKPQGENKYKLKLYELDKKGNIVGEANRFGLHNKFIDLKKRYQKGTVEYKLQKLISHSIRKEKRIRIEKEKLNSLKTELKTIPKNSVQYQSKTKEKLIQEQKISKIEKSMPKILRKASVKIAAKIGSKAAIRIALVGASGLISKLPYVGAIAQAATDAYMMYRVEDNSKNILENKKNIALNTQDIKQNKDAIKLNTQYIERLEKEQSILKQNIANNSYKINQILQNLIIVNSQINYLKMNMDNMADKLNSLTYLVQKNAKAIKEIKNGIFITGIQELKDYYDTKDPKYLGNSINDFEMTKNIKNNEVVALDDYYLIIAHYENFLLNKSKMEIANIDILFTDLKNKVVENYHNITLFINAYNAVLDNEYLRDKYKNTMYRSVKETINQLIRQGNFDKAVDISKSFGNNGLIKYAEKKRKENFLKYKDFNSIQVAEYIIRQYQNAFLNKEAVKFLYKNDAYLEALSILQNKRIEDEDFVLKAYLLIYQQLGYNKKLKALVNLIIENKTYSENIKKYVTENFVL